METRGIDIVPESERTAKPSDLFWPWFAANISVFGISYGSFVLWFGLSFWQGALVTALGVTFSFFLCGLIAVAGKRGSAPTMVLSRAAFGVEGQKVPGIVSWLTSIGWETFLSIMAVLATTTVIRELGGDPGTGTKITATVIVAGLIVAVSVLGYHAIMKLQSVLTWITGAVTVLYMALTIPRIDWAAVGAVSAGSAGDVVGALVMVMTGFGLGWINIAADWSRYQRRDTPDSPSSSGTLSAAPSHPRFWLSSAFCSPHRMHRWQTRSPTTQSVRSPLCSPHGCSCPSLSPRCCRWSPARYWASTPRG